MQNLTNQVVNSNLPQVQAVTQQYAPASVPMQNYAPQYYQPVQTQPQTPQSSGVNIIIYNPSVNPTAGTVANSTNSYNVPSQSTTPTSNANASASTNVSYPANYYTQEPKKTPTDEVAKSYLANTPIKETKPEEKKKEPETHKENIVQLTDDYVKTLENYMNNPNVKIREMAVKELMARFKEHKSRYNDVALTNLLNKALQDRAKSVRFVALATLDSEYAQGDKLTTDLLNKMQGSSSVFGEDALMASEILLKMSRKKVEIDAPGKAPEDKKAK